MNGARPQPELLTARLRLRPFVAADASEVQRLAGEREVAETTLNIPHPYPDGAAAKWIAEHATLYEGGDGVVFAVTDRASGALLGAVGLRSAPRHARAELGYWIGRPYWGRGYATEAVRAMLCYGFATLDLNRIHACHFARNPASGRVMAKAGMQLEGVARQHFRRGDRAEDAVTYAILREEYDGS